MLKQLLLPQLQIDEQNNVIFQQDCVLHWLLQVCNILNRNVSADCRCYVYPLLGSQI
jgi:hypothetical protein